MSISHILRRWVSLVALLLLLAGQAGIHCCYDDPQMLAQGSILEELEAGEENDDSHPPFDSRIVVVSIPVVDLLIWLSGSPFFESLDYLPFGSRGPPASFHLYS
tara:strand:+ start:1226 stop:1537 length:312 start_codon:yes stop_codon:yes gene_type:complete